MKKITHVKFRKNISQIFVLCCFVLFLGCNSEEGAVKNPAEAEMVQEQLNSVDLLNPEEVISFYESRKYEPVWNNEDFRNEFLEVLRDVKKEGLFFKDYHGESIENVLNNDLNEEDNSQLDILLTDAYFELSDHLLNGKLEPSKMYGTWGIIEDKMDRAGILAAAIQHKEISESIDSLRPHNGIYYGLMTSLEEFGKKRTDITDIEEGGKIAPGDEDERIPALIVRLKELRLLPKDFAAEGNKYAEEIVEAVKIFQEEQGLALDGVIGHTTIEALNIDNVERYKQILVNLERWRWYPQNLGDHYFVVNIPDYKVAVIKGGDTIQTHRAIVGKEETGTPIFTDTIQYVVFNPTWTIPASIRDNEVTAGLSKSSNYLSRNNMEVLDAEGNIVDPSGVTAENAKNYTFRQRAGASNPLGRVKIIYPNKYAVYLHDTPGQHRFDENTRGLSHGCVRVQDAIGLAAYVLGDQPEWNKEKIQEVIASGKTQQVPVKQKIAVHHLYWTAWHNDGETKFVQDIYGFDDEVYEKLIN